MANFYDPKFEPNTDHDISNVQLVQGKTISIGLFGGAGADRNYSDLFVSSTDPATVRCDMVTRLAKDKTAYYNQWDVSKIDTVEVRKQNRRYVQLLGLKAGTAQIQASLDPLPTTSNQYSSAVTVTVTANNQFLNVGTPFGTLWSNHPGDDDPCNVPGLAGQCAVKMGVMFQDSGVSLAGVVGHKCWGAGADHRNHFLDPNDIGRWLSGKQLPYIWTAGNLAPEPMPGIAARAFVDGKTGIVMFLDFWNVGKAAPFLDHIDIWNKTQQKHGAETYFLRSREIQFWQIS